MEKSADSFASRGAPRRPLLERIAGWSARNRKTAVFGWLLLVVLAVGVGQALGTKELPAYDPGESGHAQQALHDNGAEARPSENVLIQAKTGDRRFADDPQLQAVAAEVVAALGTVPDAASGVRSPLDPANARQISADGRSAIVGFDVPGKTSEGAKRVKAALAAVATVQAAHPDVTVAEAGSASVARAVNDSIGKDFARAEMTSVPLTLVILLLVFGALIAAGIPLLLAGTSVIAGLALLAVPSHWIPITPDVSSVVLLIGMAVGVDYSLFYLRREREERAAGRSPAEALRIATATSGRAVVVSGLTVMISIAGLYLTGIDKFTGIATGTIVVVGVSVVGSVTFLPALLSWLGHKVDGLRLPLIGRRRTAAGDSKLWSTVVRGVVARPLVLGGAAVLVLAALAVPALGMRTADSGSAELPAKIPTFQTLSQIREAFPGSPAPAEVVVTGDNLTGSAMNTAIAGLHQAAAAGGALHEPVTVRSLADGHVLLVSVPLAGGGTDRTSVDALQTLRTEVLPGTLGKVSGIDYAVTGQTAGTHDFSAALSSSTPVVFGFVLLLAFLLLIAAFRSVAIPLTAICLNLLSIAASYGVLKLVFQDGHLEGLLGFHSYGAIVPWLPLFMFVILFGLSMDYHVFLLSRIRELRNRGASTPDAIVGGISGSAGVVSSAALVMVAVFAIFATLDATTYKMIGVGMAVAVLIDATLVRGILVPATMAVLGERNWYLPSWLNWIPGIELEGGSEPEPVQAPAAPVVKPLVRQ